MSKFELSALSLAVFVTLFMGQAVKANEPIIASIERTATKSGADRTPSGAHTTPVKTLGTIPVCNDARSDLFTNQKTCQALTALPIIRSHSCPKSDCLYNGSTLRYESKDCEIWLMADHRAYWVGVTIKPTVDLDLASGELY